MWHTFFAKAGDACNLPGRNENPFFGFPHWWQYLDGEKDAFNQNCVPKVTMPDGLWAVGLAVIDILLYLAGIVAVVSIIISGVMYVTSQGNSEKAASARKRIINSFIGLAIVLFATGIVGFIGSKLT